MYSLRSRRKVEVKEPVVEKIVNKRVNDEGQLEYFVKWKDLPDSDNAWKPAETLDCLKLVALYEHATMYESLHKRKFDETENLPSGSVPKKKACAEESNVHFDSLPTEIMIKIFQHLSQNDLGRIAQVNRRWNKLTRCKQLWKPVDVRFQWKNGSQNKVATVFLKNLPASVTHLKLHFWSLDWNEPLEFSAFCIKLSKKCRSLKVLMLQFAVFDINLPSAIYLCSQHLQNLEVLSFGQCTFTDKFVERQKDLLFRRSMYPEDLLMISLSRMTNLQKLSIYCMEANDSRFRAGPPFLGKRPSFRVGQRNLPLMNDQFSKLRELNLCGTSVILNFYDLLDPVFSQLKTVCLKRCKNITLKFIFDLVISIEFLENVYVDNEIAAHCADVVSWFPVETHRLKIVKTSETCRHCENDYSFEQ